MAAIGRVLKRHWTWLRWCILLVSVGILLLLLLFMYVFFFGAPDQAFKAVAWPPDQARIQTLEPHFYWPDGDVGQFLFEIHRVAPPGPALVSTRTRKPEVTVPRRVLSPGEHYRWRVLELESDGAAGEILLQRDFQTAPAMTRKTFWNLVTVFPATLSITPDRMRRRFALEVDYAGPWRVSLPDALVFVDGEKLMDGEGPMVVYFYFDQARAPADVNQWKPVRIWAGGRVVEIPLVAGTRPNAVWYQGADPGFNPYRDTPSFANFERSLLARLTEGTCVGIALVVKLFAEHVQFGPDATGLLTGDFLTATRLLNSVLTASRIAVRSSQSFRDFSDKQPDLVMSLMSSLHMENLNPQHLRETLKSLFGQAAPEQVERTLFAALESGELPLVAGFRLRRKVVKFWDALGRFSVLDSGHAFIVYRAWRFGDATVFAVYDPNFEYRPESPRLTTLTFYRDGRTAYFVGDQAQTDLVRFVPMETGKLFTFFALAGHGARKNLSDAPETLRDIFHTLLLE